MWRRLLRDDKHKTSPARRCSFLLEGIGLCLESLGAETRQACDLEGEALELDSYRNSKFPNLKYFGIEKGATELYSLFLEYKKYTYLTCKAPYLNSTVASKSDPVGCGLKPVISALPARIGLE
ncbi:Uncharacterised protein [Cytobacillus firmus]|nr:Uncharacterised protein [Cytobacillus firmus]